VLIVKSYTSLVPMLLNRTTSIIPHPLSTKSLFPKKVVGWVQWSSQIPHDYRASNSSVTLNVVWTRGDLDRAWQTEATTHLMSIFNCNLVLGLCSFVVNA
jgi:hypothetical protein